MHSINIPTVVLNQVYSHDLLTTENAVKIEDHIVE